MLFSPKFYLGPDMCGLRVSAAERLYYRPPCVFRYRPTHSGEALEIDCADVVKLLARGASELKFIEGFVVIESKDDMAARSYANVRRRDMGP